LLPYSWGEEILEQIDVLAIAPAEDPRR